MAFPKHILSLVLACLLAACLTVAAPAGGRRDGFTLKTRQTSDKLVFCHFMIGIVSNRKSAADYDDDMKRAKSYGIDAFALNIGVDPFTDEQLGYAYESATNNGMKVFISFDFNWYKDASQAAEVGAMIKKYGGSAAQLKVDGKAFVSSFSGDKLDVKTVRAMAGMDLYIAPNWHPQMGTDLGPVDGALNWMAWSSNGDNKAPSAGTKVTVSDGDQIYMKALGNKGYIAPVSPWFSTHFGPEVSYSKNWVFPSDLLWYTRWNELLTLGSRFIEIITWNDYGESHYIGPLSSSHTDDGASKWVNDMPHTGWLDMAKPFIAAYKAGAKDVRPFIKNDQLVYWYRPTPRSLNCDATDTTTGSGGDNSTGNYFHGRPNGAESLDDAIFVVSLLTAPGKVTITSGGKTQSFDAPAGASSYTVPMGTGQQKFALARNGADVFAETSLKDVVNECKCGVYNFNAYVGTVPAAAPDHLQGGGLASLVKGLHVQTCQAMPSLGSAPLKDNGPMAIAAAPAPGSAPSPAAINSPVVATPPPSAPASGSATPVPPSPSTPASGSAAPAPPSPSTPNAMPAPHIPIPAAALPPKTPAAQPAPAAAAPPAAQGKVITSLSQLAPANCLPKGDIWAGPAGSDKPDKCDG